MLCFCNRKAHRVYYVNFQNKTSKKSSRVSYVSNLTLLVVTVSTKSQPVVQDRAQRCLHGKGELGKIRLSQFVRLLIVSSHHARMLLARPAKLTFNKVFSPNIYFYGYMKL